MDASDDDEPIDFSQLTKRAPRRSTKHVNVADQDPGTNAVEQSRAALMEVISETKRVNPRTTSRAQFDRDTGLTTVIQSKGTHLHTVGHTSKGQLRLWPEEAAWLISRHALIVTDTNDQACSFEDYCQLMFSTVDGWLSYEKYQVYAYLKRLGYIVQRTRAYEESFVQQELPIPWHRRICHLVHRLYAWFSRCLICCWPFPTMPLVVDKQCTNYRQVYSTLRVIPSTPWYKPFAPVNQYQIAWDVYRPNPQWKKRDPGIPDFRVVVGSLYDPVPSLETYQQLMHHLTQLPMPKSSFRIANTQSSEHAPSFLMALVGDTEGITFLRFTGDGVADIAADI
ncbi:uncharacterized protein BYT42DRAFT_613056 [Radiomyces spectabilis]|uniref:uncharacterized protein n=1 Tax=Radiomyces spectabilis TaxID=64574 RepID=UPI002220F9DF|nr:uncharacterized protein BYT42DRAFT_613056 [Radiomyces spectabilis]KAI8381260.1 hypothetical protein BYT42DRAFT_613056 [Radiomyces spectabilis]